MTGGEERMTGERVFRRGVYGGSVSRCMIYVWGAGSRRIRAGGEESSVVFLSLGRSFWSLAFFFFIRFRFVLIVV